jgi:hypothetical protein
MRPTNGRIVTLHEVRYFDTGDISAPSTQHHKLADATHTDRKAPQDSELHKPRQPHWDQRRPRGAAPRPANDVLTTLNEVRSYYQTDNS